MLVVQLYQIINGVKIELSTPFTLKALRFSQCFLQDYIFIKKQDMGMMVILLRKTTGHCRASNVTGSTKRRFCKIKIEPQPQPGLYFY